VKKGLRGLQPSTSARRPATTANHTLFGSLNGDGARSGGVASITNLSGDPRVMQFAIRMNW
jgi:hypothetical protein